MENVGGYTPIFDHTKQKKEEKMLQKEKKISTFESDTNPDHPTLFKTHVTNVLRREGGKANHNSDRGGETNRGITLTTWTGAAKRVLGKEPTIENLWNLTEADATKIYWTDFWKPSRAEEIKNDSLRDLYFDFTAHSGVGNSVKNLQRALNQTGVNVDTDDIIGSKTIEAINNHPNMDSLYHEYYRTRDKFRKKVPNSEKFQKGFENRMKEFKR